MEKVLEGVLNCRERQKILNRPSLHKRYRTFVNKFEMSKEQKKTEEGSKFEVVIISAKVKESGLQLRDLRMRTDSRGEDRYLASWCCAEPVTDRMCRSGTSFLWPYMRGR